MIYIHTPTTYHRLHRSTSYPSNIYVEYDGYTVAANPYSVNVTLPSQHGYTSQGTVMRIIKLKIFMVPVRLHSVYSKLIFVINSQFLQYLRT